MSFVANFIGFSALQENQLRFDKVTEREKVGTFLSHSVEVTRIPCNKGFCTCWKEEGRFYTSCVVGQSVSRAAR